MRATEIERYPIDGEAVIPQHESAIRMTHAIKVGGA